MICLWRYKNDLRREQAKMIAKLKDVPMEFGEFGEMPMYLKVPVAYRNKTVLDDLTLELQAEEDAALKEAEKKQEVDSANDTASTSLLLMPIMAKPPADPLEVGSTIDGLSPRRLDDVEVDDEENDAA
eukprot:834765-Amphidinium_carterae.1